MSRDLPEPGDFRAVLEYIRDNAYGVGVGHTAVDLFVDLGMTEVSLRAFIDEVLREAPNDWELRDLDA